MQLVERISADGYESNRKRGGTIAEAIIPPLVISASFDALSIQKKSKLL